MKPARLLLILAAVALLGSNLVSAFAASNSVPTTRIGEATDGVTVQKLAPSQCSSLTLTGFVQGSGTVSGGGGAELLLGSAVADTINGGGGNDCLVGGGANDPLNGGQGTDVCIGGPGTDTFQACETQIQ